MDIPYISDFFPLDLLNIRQALYNETQFLGAFMGFVGQKRHFYGSHKPQIEFNYIGPALF